jgi:hypothetical protein
MDEARSEYLESLKHNQLYLTSSIPVEVTGKRGNYVASWLEGGVEGEGTSVEAAIEDLREEIVKLYFELRGKAHNKKQEQKWHSLCYFVSEVNRSRRLPGEDDDNNGPIFG